jgi:hypothetical protein
VVEVVVVEAPNNAYIIRNPLVAVRKGLRVAVVDLKVSTLFTRYQVSVVSKGSLFIG